MSSNADITTYEATSRGILAQSLSGAGGAGAAGFGAVFGSGGTGASSGTVGAVTITNGGVINTAGSNSLGILAQSIAGGGGAGGQGLGVLGAVGGDATTNPLTANAGAVTVNLMPGGIITTSGPSALGVLVQSIGGGGGNAGNAAANALFAGFRLAAVAATAATAGKPE